MAKRREARRSHAAAVAEATQPPRPRWWLYPLGVFGAVLLTFQVYDPVLRGPFVFDDTYLPFMVPNFPDQLRAWLTSVRPLLMLTYWVNFSTARLDTLPYHALNLLFHAANGVLIFFIVRKFLSKVAEEGWRRDLLALFSGALFLVHPVQTESVAYVASRSENQSLFFFLAAFAVFMYRRTEAVTWRVALVVVALFGAAATTKEHTVVLPALLLLTDYFWNPGFSFAGARRNWRVYVPIALGGAAGLALVAAVLRSAASAGFNIKAFTWYQYFFTQCRAIWVYLRLFLLPVDQTADYDFPISRGILDHGAIFGLAGLLLLGGAALWYRKRFPLASYGLLTFFLLLAPTSSFVPLMDPVAERRLYLPFLGLLLVTVDILRRVKLERSVLAAVLLLVVAVLDIAAYQRNHVWSDEILLWEDTVAKSPNKARAHFQLAYQYFHNGRCADALSHYQKVSTLQKPNYDLLVDWALAYDCANRRGEAIATLKRAAEVERSAHVFATMAMVYGKDGKWAEALDALRTAESIDPNYPMIYVYRGGVHSATGQLDLANQEFNRALQLDPGNQLARDGLREVQQRRRAAKK